MTPVRQPRNLAQATVLCERHAVLDGQIAGIEATRDRDIAAIQADADRALVDLTAERATIAGKLEPWWAQAGPGLTHGKRKSIELGGCAIGSAEGRAGLDVADDKAAVAGLQQLPWRKPFLRLGKVSLDKAALLKALPTMAADRVAALAGLGVKRREGEDTFFVRRLEQGGTIAETGK